MAAERGQFPGAGAGGTRYSPPASSSSAAAERIFPAATAGPSAGAQAGRPMARGRVRKGWDSPGCFNAGPSPLAPPWVRCRDKKAPRSLFCGAGACRAVRGEAKSPAKRFRSCRQNPPRCPGGGTARLRLRPRPVLGSGQPPAPGPSSRAALLGHSPFPALPHPARGASAQAAPPRASPGQGAVPGTTRIPGPSAGGRSGGRRLRAGRKNRRAAQTHQVRDKAGTGAAAPGCTRAFSASRNTLNVLNN